MPPTAGMLATIGMLTTAGTPATEETLAKAEKHAIAVVSNRDTVCSSDAYIHYIIQGRLMQKGTAATAGIPATSRAATGGKLATAVTPSSV